MKWSLIIAFILFLVIICLVVSAAFSTATLVGTPFTIPVFIIISILCVVMIGFFIKALIDFT